MSKFIGDLKRNTSAIFAYMSPSTLFHSPTTPGSLANSPNGSPPPAHRRPSYVTQLSQPFNIDTQPKGTIQYVHLTQDPISHDALVSVFDPASIDSAMHRKKSVYQNIRCKYRMDCTPVQAHFVHPPNQQLNQWLATAISGNDITSSVIYTAGLVAVNAGYYTPLCLLMVVLLLYFFRSVYVELVTALPLNGGTYTGLLNTTRKSIAVIAACLSFLSYAATVVVSANSAILYLTMLWPTLNTVLGTCVVIGSFAFIMLLGIKESAIVAAIIFIAHIATLLILMFASLAYAIHTKFAFLVAHYRGPGPTNVFSAIILGFSNAMLGVTGFETSANFVQEQKPGVFSKTLRNMWFAVALINPTISILGFCVVPTDKFYASNSSTEVTSDTRDALLAQMGLEMSGFIGGNWLQTTTIADATIVLCGAVLTGFIGVTGLLKRMVHDDILPRAFDATMPVTGANYPSVIFFAVVCLSLTVVTWGNIQSISGVYTIAFLSVMFLFCVSNLMLKHTRRELKKEATAKWYVVLMCMGALIVALAGNCFSDPIIIGYAALYGGIFMTIFMMMFSRTFLIRGFLHLTDRLRSKSKVLRRLRKSLAELLVTIEERPVAFFSRRLNLREMNMAVQRVLSDELTKNLTVVHLYDRLLDIPTTLNYTIKVLDCLMYPNIKIDVLLIHGTFGPGAVRVVEAILKIPPNRMFIAAPSRDLSYNVAELGSVRIIMSRRDADLTVKSAMMARLPRMSVAAGLSDLEQPESPGKRVKFSQANEEDLDSPSNGFRERSMSL